MNDFAVVIPQDEENSRFYGLSLIPDQGSRDGLNFKAARHQFVERGYSALDFFSLNR